MLWGATLNNMAVHPIIKPQKTWNKNWQGETIKAEALNTPLSVIDRTSKQKINEKIEVMNNTINQIGQQTSIDYSTQKQQKYSSQVHMEHSPGQTMC